MAFTALWAFWQGEDGSQALSCALLTKAASPTIVHIHDRMPVVLKAEYLDAWSGPKTQGRDVQDIVSYALADFVSYPVSKRSKHP